MSKEETGEASGSVWLSRDVEQPGGLSQRHTWSAHRRHSTTRLAQVAKQRLPISATVVLGLAHAFLTVTTPAARSGNARTASRT